MNRLWKWGAQGAGGAPGCGVRRPPGARRPVPQRGAGHRTLHHGCPRGGRSSQGFARVSQAVGGEGRGPENSGIRSPPAPHPTPGALCSLGITRLRLDRALQAPPARPALAARTASRGPRTGPRAFSPAGPRAARPPGPSGANGAPA